MSTFSHRDTHGNFASELAPRTGLCEAGRNRPLANVRDANPDTATPVGGRHSALSIIHILAMPLISIASLGSTMRREMNSTRKPPTFHGNNTYLGYRKIKSEINF